LDVQRALLSVLERLTDPAPAQCGGTLVVRGAAVTRRDDTHARGLVAVERIALAAVVTRFGDAAKSTCARFVADAAIDAVDVGFAGSSWLAAPAHARAVSVCNAARLRGTVLVGSANGSRESEPAAVDSVVVARAEPTEALSVETALFAKFQRRWRVLACSCGLAVRY